MSLSLHIWFKFSLKHLLFLGSSEDFKGQLLNIYFKSDKLASQLHTRGLIACLCVCITCTRVRAFCAEQKIKPPPGETKCSPESKHNMSGGLSGQLPAYLTSENNNTYSPSAACRRDRPHTSLPSRTPAAAQGSWCIRGLSQD